MMTLNELAKSILRLNVDTFVWSILLGIALCNAVFVFLIDRVNVLCILTTIASLAVITVCIVLAVTSGQRYTCKYIGTSSVPVLEVEGTNVIEAREVNEVRLSGAFSSLKTNVVGTTGEISGLYSLTDYNGNVGTLHEGDKIEYITLQPTAKFKEDCSEYLNEILMKKITDLKIVVKINGIDPYEKAPLEGLAKEIYDDIIKGM